MKSISFDEALEQVRKAEKLNKDDIAHLQAERLQELVAYVRKNSAVYEEKYKNLPDNPTLEDLPPVTKQELCVQMENWICDPDFSNTELTSFIQDHGTTGMLFMDKYSVSTTSGTTGEPLRMLRDARHVNVNGALMQSRFNESALFKNASGLADPNVHVASVIATGGHHAAYTAFQKREKMLAAQGIVNTMLLLPIDTPIEESVRKLNEFQPKLLTGYPSALQVLANEQHAKRLNISPEIIVCSAEQLTDETRLLLAERFSCPVGNVFCSTEGGEIALLCDHGKMHLNSDWIIVEPVDENNNPVPEGKMSQAVLVTNLANAVQPIIRYRVDDSVILHNEPCECGQPFPFIEILGRTNDIPTFTNGKKQISLTPLLFVALTLHVEGLAISQFVQTGPENLILKVQYSEEANAESVNKELHKLINDTLASNGLANVTVDIRNEAPARAERGRKMKYFVNAF
ncbi:MAG: phenylacetate--CoA ligase family protein [Desulfovibrio sp.]